MLFTGSTDSVVHLYGLTSLEKAVSNSIFGYIQLHAWCAWIVLEYSFNIKYISVLVQFGICFANPFTKQYQYDFTKQAIQVYRHHSHRILFSIDSSQSYISKNHISCLFNIYGVLAFCNGESWLHYWSILYSMQLSIILLCLPC